MRAEAARSWSIDRCSESDVEGSRRSAGGGVDVRGAGEDEGGGARSALVSEIRLSSRVACSSLRVPRK